MNEKSIGQFLYAKEANLWLKVIPEVMEAVSHDHDASSPFAVKDDASCKADGTCDGD